MKYKQQFESSQSWKNDRRITNINTLNGKNLIFLLCQILFNIKFFDPDINFAAFCIMFRFSLVYDRIIGNRQISILGKMLKSLTTPYEELVEDF